METKTANRKDEMVTTKEAFDVLLAVCIDVENDLKTILARDHPSTSGSLSYHRTQIQASQDKLQTAIADASVKGR